MQEGNTRAGDTYSVQGFEEISAPLFEISGGDVLTT
jgi:hypothetical protein